MKRKLTLTLSNNMAALIAFAAATEGKTPQEVVTQWLENVGQAYLEDPIPGIEPRHWLRDFPEEDEADEEGEQTVSFRLVEQNEA